MEKFRHLAIAFLLCLLAGVQSWAATQFVGGRTDFRDETIYFVMTTRFYDGDPSNNTYCWDGKNNVNDPEWRGDFKGLIEKLDYIKALGFTAIWITPVVENASGLDYHGYHAINFSKVDHRYESEDVKFQDLINAAHARGIKIVLDIVIQHTGNFGEEHLCPLFAKDYTVNPSNISKYIKLHPDTPLPANYFSLPAGTQYQMRLAMMKNTDGQNHDTNNYWHHWGSGWNWDETNRWWGQIAGDCVDLNTENPAVIDYLTSAYGKFMEMGVDAFRIDTSGHVARLAFTRGFIPKFQALAEQHKAKRLGQTPFFMFGEVCSRYSEATYRGHDCLSPYYYTWQSPAKYQWSNDIGSLATEWIKEGDDLGSHINHVNAIQEGEDYKGTGHYTTSSSKNAFLNGNAYHTPDYSEASGMSVIDFTMHWQFGNASQAFGVKRWDGMYNDATWNVVYVDSHDYGPDSFNRYAGGTAAWAENMDLMFTFRGIPCLYYGSEVEFRKGVRIDEGANLALKNSGRAYFGGYLTGSVNTTDFGEYSSATGNLAATLSQPLPIHLARLNKIRAAVPALRKGQYSTDGCSGGIAFKRRYTDSTTDSYCLVNISGNATFTGIENGTYTDCITGQTQTVTNGSLTSNCSGKGNMRVWVLSTAKTPAPGKVGNDGQFLYGSSPVTTQAKAYDGNEEAPDTNTQRDTDVVTPGGGEIVEPEEPITPSMAEGEQAVFFETEWSTVSAWIWSTSKNYTGGSWPGQTLTYLGNHVWKWTYSGSDKVSGKVIFSQAGSNQTSKDGWDYVNGGYYNASGYVKTIEGAGEITGGDDPVTPPTPSDAFNVYWDNTSAGWTTPRVHYWGGASQSTWPGVVMTKVSGNIWVCNVVAGTSGLVFNDGNGSQTGNLTAVANHIYSQAGDQGEYDGNFTPPTPSNITYTIYYDDANTSWGTVHAWVWSDAMNYTGGSWPGRQMTRDDASGYHKYTFEAPSDAALKCIFSGGGQQTDDLELKNNGVYNKDGYVKQYVSGITDATAVALKVYVRSGEILIDTPDETDVTIYRADGTSTCVHLYPGVNTVSGLPRGFYIVAGKKVII